MLVMCVCLLTCYIWNYWDHVLGGQTMGHVVGRVCLAFCLAYALLLFICTCVHLRLLLGFRIGQVDRWADVRDHAGMVRRTKDRTMGSWGQRSLPYESALRVCLGGFLLYNVSWQWVYKGVQ